MKTIMISLGLTLLLTACTTTQPNMANPASVFCTEQGGISIIKTDKDNNQYGVCQLPNGKEVDEWDYYRKNSPKK